MSWSVVWAQIDDIVRQSLLRRGWTLREWKEKGCAFPAHVDALKGAKEFKGPNLSNVAKQIEKFELEEKLKP